MKFSKLFLVALAGSLFFLSCNNDDDFQDIPLGSYDNGVLVLNQGNFGVGNASVSYISDNFATQQNNIFSLVNPTMTLGDTGQDIGFYGDLAFVVLNYSAKIEVVNRYTFESVATISQGFDNPRYIAFANGKGYVTNWGDGQNPDDDFVAVIDLNSYTVTSTIPVAEGPERIIASDSKLYVAHGGGYGFESTVSVINIITNSVTSIEVDFVPNSLAVQDGVLYVLSGGKPAWSNDETEGSLKQINLNNNTIVTYAFAQGLHPSNLLIEGNKIYYTVDSDIFAKNLNDALPATPLFSTTPQGVYGVYSFALKNNRFYIGDAVDYSSNGKVYIYTANGALENEYTVGVIPTGFYFND